MTSTLIEYFNPDVNRNCRIDVPHWRDHHTQICHQSSNNSFTVIKIFLNHIKTIKPNLKGHHDDEDVKRVLPPSTPLSYLNPPLTPNGSTRGPPVVNGEVIEGGYKHNRYSRSNYHKDINERNAING